MTYRGRVPVYARDVYTGRVTWVFNPPCLWQSRPRHIAVCRRTGDPSNERVSVPLPLQGPVPRLPYLSVCLSIYILSRKAVYSFAPRPSRRVWARFWRHGQEQNPVPLPPLHFLCFWRLGTTFYLPFFVLCHPAQYFLCDSSNYIPMNVSHVLQAREQTLKI